MKKKSFILTLFIFTSALVFVPFFKTVAASPLDYCCNCSCMSDSSCINNCSECGEGGTNWCSDDPDPSTLREGGITNPFLSDSIQDLTGTTFLGRLLPNLITLFIIAAAVTGLFFLLTGGIRWITSSGDRDNLAAAQKTITAAIIGLAVTLSVYAIMKLIGFFFGVDLINFDISPLMLD